MVSTVSGVPSLEAEPRHADARRDGVYPSPHPQRAGRAAALPSGMRVNAVMCRTRDGVRERLCRGCRAWWHEGAFHRMGRYDRDTRCSACRAELTRARQAAIGRSRSKRSRFESALVDVLRAFGARREEVLDRRGGRHQHGRPAEARAALVRALRPALTVEAIAVLSGLSEGSVRKAGRR